MLCDQVANNEHLVFFFDSPPAVELREANCLEVCKARPTPRRMLQEQTHDQEPILSTRLARLEQTVCTLQLCRLYCCHEGLDGCHPRDW
jgi:hypothetical protein